MGGRFTCRNRRNAASVLMRSARRFKLPLGNGERFRRLDHDATKLLIQPEMQLGFLRRVTHLLRIQSRDSDANRCRFCNAHVGRSGGLDKHYPNCPWRVAIGHLFGTAVFADQKASEPIPKKCR